MIEAAARNYARETNRYGSASIARATIPRRPTSIAACPAAEVIDQCDVDDAEIAQLVDRYAHRVRYFTHRIELRFRIDPQWHDDLISSGFWGLLKAVRNRREEAHERELSAYISRRIEGAIIDEARRVLNRVTNHADCDPTDLDAGLAGQSVNHDWEFGSLPEDPEDAADRSSRCRAIEASIEHLDADQRALLKAYAEGRSLSEIARDGDQTASRLQSEMTRISRQLRSQSPELRRLLRGEI